MNTNYDDEATKFQTEEETTIEDNKKNLDENNESNEKAADHTDEAAEQSADESEAAPEGNQETAAEKPEGDSAKSKWKKAAGSAGLGAGLGVGLGGVATMTMGMQDAHHVDPITPEPLEHPSWSDGKIPVATSVNDSMTQNEAFAAAREEVGPGGAFEWHGNVYNTYTAEEWASMSREEQIAFNDHFSWNQGSEHTGNHHSSHSYTAHNDIQVDPVTPEDPAENPDVHGKATASTDGPAEGDDIDVITVDHPGDNNITAEVTDPTGGDVTVTAAEPEIEILGVVHDAESGTNVGGMLVDGQEVLVVDLDGDMTFDVMASDIDGNGALDNNEIIDIHQQGLTVADMGGFSNPTDDLMASNDAPDYTADPIYEG